jgi:hypothetical protein
MKTNIHHLGDTSKPKGELATNFQSIGFKEYGLLVLNSLNRECLNAN